MWHTHPVDGLANLWHTAMTVLVYGAETVDSFLYLLETLWQHKWLGGRQLTVTCTYRGKHWSLLLPCTCYLLNFMQESHLTSKVAINFWNCYGQVTFCLNHHTFVHHWHAQCIPTCMCVTFRQQQQPACAAIYQQIQWPNILSFGPTAGLGPIM